jgi:hypothetical protein
VLKPKERGLVTTEEIIIHIFYHVDHAMLEVPKHPLSKLYPSEIVTIGILFALGGGHFRAFYRWLFRDYAALLAGLPERTVWLRPLKSQQVHTDLRMAQPSVLNGVDSFPIALICPIRQGRSKAQYGTKSRDKGRWSVGIKVTWILNTFGQVTGWIWDNMNVSDNTFLDYLGDWNESMRTDYGFRCANGVPDNVKVCKTGTWNDRMAVETAFSMLTVICKAKKIHHRVEIYLETRLAFMAAMFNICLKLFHELHPKESPFKMSFAEFSL